MENPGAIPPAWIPARLPGAVQLDWERAEGWADRNVAENVLRYAGLEDSFWVYRTTIPVVEDLGASDSLGFVCRGIDHHAELFVDGKPVDSATGLESSFDLDVSAWQGRELQIVLHPAPKSCTSPVDRTQANATTKPAVSYGWDWHPRLIPLGIAGPVGFLIRPKLRITHVDAITALAEDFSEATIRVDVETSEPFGPLEWRLLDPQGLEVLTGHTGETAPLREPRLWWPHDQGVPHLYTLEIAAPVAGGKPWRKRIGFRRVRLVEAPGTWDEPSTFPKSRSLPPITLEVNGRRIFGKGTNWVNPSIFPSEIDAGTYNRLLGLAKETHFNILRCWGGAWPPGEAFYECCDELGLLVWQDFPLACNVYPNEPGYLAELEAAARSVVRRARQHPSLALWCGGNELFNAWSRMTDQSLPLRLLNRICYEMDPLTPFLPTSPIEGVGHGDYRFLDEHGRDIFQIFQRSKNTAYTEFGCPGPAPLAALERFLPADELWPPRPGGSWQLHHGFGAWDAYPDTWLCVSTLDRLFGPSASLRELLARGEWLQSEGYRSVYEEARRQWPACSMALNWCFNEPWPCAANNSLVHWPCEPKAALKAVRLACRPVVASARIPKFQWTAGEDFTSELWILNDSPEILAGGHLTAFLELNGTAIELLTWKFPPVPERSSQAGPSVRYHLPTETPAHEFNLRVEIKGFPQWSSSYRLSLRPPASSAKPESRKMNV